MLGESVDVYLDAGPTPGPLPSTIVDATGDTLRVVREGVISLERLREVIPRDRGRLSRTDARVPPHLPHGRAR